MSAPLPAIIYLLCTATSLACMVLLLRSYLASGVRLLLWSALCFVGLAVNNLLVFLDLVVLPSIDLLLYRHIATVAALSVLLFGFIWEGEQ